MAKDIPYGVSNFVSVIRNNKYYVDKTMFIPELEKAGDFLFFIRPRRFGKSLLLSMLAAYYDLAMKDRFQELFGDLYIGQHPTQSQGQFQMLTMDFSVVSSSSEGLETSFNQYCLRRVQDFVRTYKDYYPEDIYSNVMQTAWGGDAINIVCGEAKRRGYRLYLILDEYDNFTNNVLNEKGHDAYHALTHASGFYREYFKMFKLYFERVIMLGVSPVTLDDVTSGYNIGTNISIDPAFNAMLGFSTDEVRTMFEYYQREGLLRGDIEAMIADMKPWYDNYCFAKQSLNESRVFNSVMVLYYLKERVKNGQAPEDMIDKNTRTDYTKMKKLLDWDHMDDSRKSVIRQIAQDGQITTQLMDMFPAYDIIRPEIFPSLLYYYGMLTIEGVKGNMLVLGIPNNNVRIQYYDYLLKMYQAVAPISNQDLNNQYYAMAYDGEWRPILEYIGQCYAAASSVRDGIEGERNIQGFFMAMLGLSPYYLVAPEMEFNHGYCDLFMMPDHSRYAEVAHSYIIELKYMKASDFEAKGEAQWTEAVEQIRGYAQAERVRVMRDGTQLHCIVVQFCGHEVKRIEEVMVED